MWTVKFNSGHDFRTCASGRSRRSFFLVAVLCTALVFLLGVSGCSRNSDEKRLERTVSIQADSIAKLKVERDSLERRGASPVVRESGEPNRYDLMSLQKQGLKDPEKQLMDSITRDSTLIPFRGSLGGTMQVEKISLLNDRWLIAEFSDGHNAGRMLVRFELHPGRRIQWKLLDAKMD